MTARPNGFRNSR